MAIETIDNAKLKVLGFLFVSEDAAKSGGAQAPPAPTVSPLPATPANNRTMNIQATCTRGNRYSFTIFLNNFKMKTLGDIYFAVYRAVDRFAIQF